jgi:membrane protease YdiL (CAAX protease family)
MSVPETPSPTSAPGLAREHDAASTSAAAVATVAAAGDAPVSRRRLSGEIWIVLGLSLGQSAVYAVVSLVAKLTAGPPLASQSVALNVSQSPRPLLDLTYQLLSIFFALVPVALALYLLGGPGRSALRRVGLDGTRPWRDLRWGVVLAASIGIPGLAFYAVGRALGITVQVQASALNASWWTIPVLVLSALQNGLLEEVVAVAYISEKLGQLRWRGPAIVAASALLRGSYHLYQGWGPFLGNAVMGVVFAIYYRRTRRVAPLVVAHFLMDMVVFVGYDLIPHAWLAGLGLT